MELRKFAKAATRAKKQKDALDTTIREGDCEIYVWNPWSKETELVSAMEAKWNDIYALEDNFSSLDHKPTHEDKSNHVKNNKLLNVGAATGNKLGI